MRRYRFGPLERRGVVGGLRGGQVVALAGMIVSVVVLLQLSSSPLMILVAMLLALVACAAAFSPIAGRTAEQWAPIVLFWGARRARGATQFRSTAPIVGAQGAPDGEPELAVDLPREVADLDILAAPLHGEEVGVIRDRRANTYTAVLAVRVRSFGLLDSGDQERRLAGWGTVRRRERASPALVDPANDAPVARLVVGRRPRWGVARHAGDHRAWAVQLLLNGGRPVHLRVEQASQSGPIATFDRGEHIPDRRHPLSHYAPIQSPSVPYRTRAGSQRAELHASCVTRGSRIFAGRRFPSLRSGRTPATSPG